MALTGAERETIVRRSADDRHWDCYSCIPRDARRLRKIAESWEVEVVEMPHEGVRCLIPVTSAQALGPRKRLHRDGNAAALREYRENIKNS